MASASYGNLSLGQLTGGTFVTPSGSSPGTYIVTGDGETHSIGDFLSVEINGFTQFYEVIGTTDHDGVVLQSGSQFGSPDVTLLSNDPYPPGDSVAVDEDPGSSYVFCFLENTLISVPGNKQIPVQKLRIGDKVLTSEGIDEKILWIGTQTVRNTLFTDSKHAPVCISAGALGDNLPLADLYVTASHGMIIDGLVINAAALVNDSTIRFVPLDEMPSEFTYYHIETENHDEIYANGSLAETFIDYVTRSGFDNYQEYLDLFGSDKTIVEIAKPRVSAQRQLPSYLVQKLGITPHYKNIDSELSDLLPIICESSDVNEWNLLLSKH